MLGSAFWLTLATLLGLCLGFAREWLLVASWGAGERSDAFLIALFLPEALRMSLAGGVLSAAALPLFLERQGERRLDWLAAILPALLGIAVALSLLLLAAAPWLVRLLGPGLAETASAQAAANLRVLAWCVPGLMLHALFSIPLQAAERFVLAGLGSLLFNLPPVLYLALHGQASQPEQLALACLLGSLLMPLVLLPSLWIEGWRPWHWRLSGVELGELGGRIAPLLLSNAASQGLALVERLVASLLGEGAVTWVNLARKLMNLPLIALMSLNSDRCGLVRGRETLGRRENPGYRVPCDTRRVLRLLRHLGGRAGLSFPEALGITGGDDPKSEDDDQNPQQVWLALHRLPPPSRQFSRPVLAIILSPEHPAPLKNGIFR